MTVGSTTVSQVCSKMAVFHPFCTSNSNFNRFLLFIESVHDKLIKENMKEPDRYFIIVNQYVFSVVRDSFHSTTDYVYIYMYITIT
jgi:hypothetical protein